MQEDTFIPTMSSRETQAFYAGVTLGKPWSRSTRKQRVAQVLDAVGLSESADTLVSSSCITWRTTRMG
jgi:ABC-type multidrug transport system ATPase subunit